MEELFALEGMSGCALYVCNVKPICCKYYRNRRICPRKWSMRIKLERSGILLPIMGRGLCQTFDSKLTTLQCGCIIFTSREEKDAL